MNMPREKEEELEDIERQEEKPVQKKSWLETLPTVWKVVGAIILFFVIQSMMTSENKNMYLILTAIVIIVLFYIGKGQPEQEDLVTPEEAEGRAEIAMKRKIARWEQFANQTRFNLLPSNNMIQRDSDGIYYDIGIEVFPPWQRTPEYYNAKVMITGKYRGFTLITMARGFVTGRERRPQKTILHPLQKISRKDRFGEDVVRRILRI